MVRVVQKYGGSSVADAQSIKRVARRIYAAKKQGHEIVVVISAMGDTTDDLLDLAKRVSDKPEPRELDMLLTTGERQSAALLAMALTDIGVPAKSYTGSQAGVLTTDLHGNARIMDITPGRILASLEEGNVVIVAGFQGVSKGSKEITTLGRGASDTTAVALAAAMDADFVEIYSDVDGVFTADPRIVPGAHQISEINYEDMLEMAACGAKILHLRCVEYARRENVQIHVRSSFSTKPGTWVKDQKDIKKEGSPMEDAIITGIAHDRSEAKVTVFNVPDEPGRAAQIFKIISETDINVDMIVQNATESGKTDISFTCAVTDVPKAINALKANQGEIGFDSITYNNEIGKVSVIGVGMRSHPGVTATFFEALSEQGINISMISTSEIRISVVVHTDDVDAAVRAAHTAFGLDREGEAIVYAGTGR